MNNEYNLSKKRNLSEIYSDTYIPDNSWTTEEIKKALSILELVTKDKLIELCAKNKIKFTSSRLEDVSEVDLVKVLLSDVKKDQLFQQLR